MIQEIQFMRMFGTDEEEKQMAIQSAKELINKDFYVINVITGDDIITVRYEVFE